MFDVFYIGKKPNLFAFEKPARDIDDAAAQCLTGYYWCIYGENDYTNFDFSYVPAPWESTHVHAWPTQWNQFGGAYLAHVDSVAERKWQFHNNVVNSKADYTQFNFLMMHNGFNTTWRPHPFDPPYIYVFGNQWYPAEKMPSVEYIVPGATERKFMDFPRLSLPERHNNRWHTLVDCEWDYSWVPDPGDPPYIYVFGNQWYPAEILPTIKHTVPGATEIKYMDYPRAKLLQETTHWHIPDYIDVDTADMSWVPDPGSPPYIYHFPSQHQSACGVTYTVPGATEIKLVSANTFTAKSTTEHWTVPSTIDLLAVDFSWHPNVLDPEYIYHFGSEQNETTGLIYTVPAATEIKLAGPAPAVIAGKQKITLRPTIFYINKGNPLAQSRATDLEKLGVDVITTRYFGSMMETIKRCANKTKTHLFWVISSENDYSGFNFDWHPSSWQMYMTHVFGSKWNKWTDTFLVNRYEFERHIKWAKDLDQFPNLNFVQDQLVATADDSSAMYFVDHGNADNTQLNTLKKRYPNIRSTRFVDNYLDTFKRIMSTATTENVWILSSLCDYSKFDFTWQPGAWEREQIHCFSNEHGAWNEKRGDTFYIPVEIFKSQMYELELLDWFSVISYNTTQDIERWPVPVVQYDGNNLVQAIKDYEFTTPYAVFANRDFGQMDHIVDCVWTEKDRHVRPMSDSNGISVIPRDIKKHLKTQVYDYPYLYKYSEDLPFNMYMDKPMDVVYISNGEPDAERWYEHLEKIVDRRDVMLNFPRFGNKLHRVQNVNGRVAAYQAAARASTTPWFFAVFAKLEVDTDFNFNWQPDLWQEPKHYIFNSRNPVNGLEYGHMGMIAYNKHLVLENNNPGIDFTLSQAHESVPIISGTAHFNQDPWTTWRTAFREVIKLRMFMETSPTLETEHRLDVWCNTATGDFSDYSKAGARDALAYYKEVQGNPAELQLSFEWDWLRERYNKSST